MNALLSSRLAEARLREAAWVARCVGRADSAPLTNADLKALAEYLDRRDISRGGVMFSAGPSSVGVWIVQDGTAELVVGAGRRRQVVQMLHPGDVDGDVQLILGMPVPYTARAVTDVGALFLAPASFERLLAERPMVARRWLSSVAIRLVRSQTRILSLLGRSLTAQVARLLLDEEVDGRIRLPQRTVAAMLGVHRPSLNKVLKDLERRGLIELGYAEMRIADPEGLARLTR